MHPVPLDVAVRLGDDRDVHRRGTSRARSPRRSRSVSVGDPVIQDLLSIVVYFAIATRIAIP